MEVINIMSMDFFNKLKEACEQIKSVIDQVARAWMDVFADITKNDKANRANRKPIQKPKRRPTYTKSTTHYNYVSTFKRKLPYQKRSY